jgi:hypothetical protein
MREKARIARTMRVNQVSIACVNKAKTSLGPSLSELTAALQKCYDKCFLPVWGYPVKLYNRKPRPGDWQFIYFEDADTADAEGYHDLTHRGQPISKVFVKTSLDDDVPVSVTASHELFEMVIDPIANLWAEANGRSSYAYETCDPVEEDTFMVSGLQMSNFVYPSWFEPFRHPKGTKFDHLGKLKKPFSMTSGGYVIIKRDGHVVQRFGSLAKKKRFAKEDRRDHRSEFRKPNGKYANPKKTRAAIRARLQPGS